MRHTEEMMRLALEEAVRDENEVPVGAVIEKDGVIIAKAHNEREGGSCFAHAEVLAMERACKRLGTRRLDRCTLYVTLEPCPMCAGAMVMAGLEKCFFGAYDEKQGCCGSVYLLTEDPAFYHRVETAGGILEKECKEILQRFFSGKR
ncbi:MAG: nucleoside deaminase [Clostridia bacterium]|nr:nucleoside deaminase [Clostridia bacterium]